MAKPNTTGGANVNDYNLGRGIVYVSELVNGLPVAWRDLGNAPAFSMTIEKETLEHKSSREGLATVDKEVVLSQKMSISFQLDEINAENLALFLSGEKGSYANPGVLGVASQNQKWTDVELGRWYDFTTAAGVRIMGVDSVDVLLEKYVDGGAGDVALVEGTDYTFDGALGRVFLKSTAANIAAGDDMNLTVTADAGAPATVNEVKALTQSNTLVAVKFVSENPANNDEQTEWQFHQVSLGPEGEASLIGEDWTVLGFSGVCQSNPTADADSPYCTTKTHSEM
jgi:hypothetical protein